MMNWIQFELFLIKQLETFRRANDSKNFQDLVDLQESVNIAPELFARHHDSHTPMADMDLNAPRGPSRSFNVKGLGEMYANHFIRQFKDIPVKLGIVSYSAGVAHFTPRTFFQSFRSIPAALAIGQIPATMMLWEMYLSDLSAGRFPGTDEDIFI